MNFDICTEVEKRAFKGPFSLLQKSQEARDVHTRRSGVILGDHVKKQGPKKNLFPCASKGKKCENEAHVQTPKFMGRLVDMLGRKRK